MEIKGDDAFGIKLKVAEQSKRIAELESGIKSALRHADKNGMGEWPAFKALRKAIKD